jgi:multimeric flavodoxin WrbA
VLPTIALFGSSRRHGNTGQLIDRIAGELGGIEVVDLSERRMSAYDYEHRNRRDDFEPLMKHVLEFGQILFATPVYWYTMSPPMKVFLDRISDFLDLPELLDDGRRLRGKRTWVVCTSIYDDPPASFVGAFADTFDYLGMRFEGVAHVNCRDGYVPARHDPEAVAFAQRIRNAPAADGATGH